MKIGRITLIDPKAAGDKLDKLGPAVERIIAKFFHEPMQFVSEVVPHDREELRKAFLRLCDEEKCPLVLTFGGTGPLADDFIPDISRQVFDRELPGFGEIMRYYSYERFKVTVLSRAIGGVRGQSLIINFPAKPNAVKFCMNLLQEGIVEALEQIGGVKLSLRGDEIVVPMEKYLPFLKWIRPPPDPDGDRHPLIK
jgi:molybdopterin adenylyltransferase